jgi:signal transduction histidine kinase
MQLARPSANALLELIDPLGAVAIGGTYQDVESGQMLLHPGAPEVDVYFPVNAVLSLRQTMSGGASCESALVGREGMVGLTGVLGMSDSPAACVVSIGGTCLRASAAAVRAARDSNASVRDAFDRYTTSRLIQVAQVAACNRLHPIGRRLARWLLMLHDRIDGDQLTLSQQTIASALGVHRPTVALELQRLHRAGAIFYRSRIIKVVDRDALEQLACECHATLHREYLSLFRARPDGPTPALAERHGDAAALEALRGIASRLLVTSLQEQSARERAEAADRAKDHFLAMVSHELRTPLQAILGWCALAKLPAAPPGAIEVIERNARAQLLVIEDLIDSARMNTNTLRIAPRPIDATAVVASAIDTIRPAAEARQVAVRMKIRDEFTPVVADADRLRQVMINVLMNSVKFSHDGGVVETQLSSRDDAIEIRIVDDGDGISADMLPHIFEPFRQGQDASENRRHGLGLGLSIARAIVELHGGQIKMTSAGPGQGATCTITLPATATSADSPAQTS